MNSSYKHIHQHEENQPYSNIDVQSLDRDPEQSTFEPPQLPAPVEIPTEAPGERKQAKLSSNCKHQPGSRDIMWYNVQFKAGEKSILTDCWGEVLMGEICAIMGPSGAGKSSLLNVLAGRSTSVAGVSIEGKITVGGREINPVTFRRNIAYVMQDDALMATATPREALRFSAHLRLPPSKTGQEINALVQKILADLGLTSCADVFIGGALIKGISGGQRKRTSVGVEIITDPSLLFLDEPTSGLDSHNAFQLVQLLKSIASDGCTILCTIHQPSSEVFFLFDSVIFMKGGRIFYQGSTAGISPYYSARNYPCPENYNPADFVMSLVQSTTDDQANKEDLFVPIPEKYTSSAKQTQRFDSVMLEFTASSSFLKQLTAILQREFVNMYRDTAALISRLAITLLLCILYGFVFLNVGGKNNADPKNLNKHVGGIQIVMMFALFSSSSAVLLNFPFERPMILREYATGTYGLLSYFISKVCIEAPLTFAQLLIAFLLVFFMMDLQGNYILLVLACFGLAMVSNSVAMAVGCFITEVKNVSQMGPLMFVPQILFAGTFIRTSKIPVYLRWAQYITAMKYSVNLVYLTEFREGSTSCDGDAREHCKQLLDDNDINADIFYVYIIILFALFLGFRIIGGMALIQKAKRFY